MADIAAAWQRELPGVRTDSIEIISPIWRIAKVLADDRRRTLSRLGVDSSTLDLLSVIRRSGPPYELTTREITRRTLVTAGAVSQRVSRAEQAGLVERSPSSASRRAVSVRLTEAGHRLIASTVSQLLEHEATLIDTLTGAERAALARCLAELDGDLTTLAQKQLRIRSTLCRLPLQYAAPGDVVRSAARLTKPLMVVAGALDTGFSEAPPQIRRAHHGLEKIVTVSRSSDHGRAFVSRSTDPVVRRRTGVREGDTGKGPPQQVASSPAILVVDKGFLAGGSVGGGV